MRNEAIATSVPTAENSRVERAVDPSADRVGHIETHGADYIPPAERHGRPRELFWVWMSANIIYLYFVIGGVLMLLGLPLWEALAITIVGNLWWAAVGWLAISGPASGTPSVAIMRAMFGVRGSRIFGAGLGVVIGVFYEIINIAFATLAAIAMIEWFGIALPAGAEWGVLVVIGALSFAISIYGHATILKLAPWFSAALAVMFVVLGGFVFGSADFSYAPAPLEPSEHIAMILLGFAIVASSPLSWGTGADYARYLPRDVSKAKVAVWTALGGFVPAVAIGTLGVVAGTVIDMTDPQLTIAQIVPAWFMPVFLGMIVLSSVTNNVLVAYSTGLYALGLGVRVSRVATIVVTGLASTAAAAWLLFVAPSFLDTLNSSLELAVTVLGPLVAVYAVDILLRRNSYDGEALAAERRDGPFWYRGGFFWPGIIAMTVATTTAVLMANTTLYVGPFALALGGADLSAIVGPLLADILYAVLWLTSAPYREPSARPAASWDDSARDAGGTAPRDAAGTARREARRTTPGDEPRDAAPVAAPVPAAATVEETVG